MSWEQLRRLKCTQLPKGLRHINDTEGTPPRLFFFRPLGCSCEVKPWDK